MHCLSTVFLAEGFTFRFWQNQMEKQDFMRLCLHSNVGLLIIYLIWKKNHLFYHYKILETTG